MLDDFNQHAAGAAGWVVDALAFGGVEDVDEQADHRAGGVVLTGLLLDWSAKRLMRYSYALPNTSDATAALESVLVEKCSIRSASLRSGSLSLLVQLALPKMP